MLYQETRNGNDGEEPVRSESYDPVGDGNDLLYQETRNGNGNGDP